MVTSFVGALAANPFAHSACRCLAAASSESPDRRASRATESSPVDQSQQQPLFGAKRCERRALSGRRPRRFGACIIATTGIALQSQNDAAGKRSRFSRRRIVLLQPGNTHYPICSAVGRPKEVFMPIECKELSLRRNRQIRPISCDPANPSIDPERDVAALFRVC